MNPFIALLAQATSRRAGTEDGQGMVEYALIIALISVVALVALSLVGENAAEGMNFITQTMGNHT